MKLCKRMSPVLLTPLLLLTLGAAAPHWCWWCWDQEEVELDEAEVFIEFNSTDGDFGIQFFWDGQAWDRMKVEGPNGRTVLKVRARRNLQDQGLTEGFFESAEPSLDELSMEEFLDRFPPGDYEFEGRTLDGAEIEGETDFTHLLPAPPANLCPEDGDEVDASMPLVVSFDAVTEDLDGNPLDPVQYELIVESEDEVLKVFTMNIDGDEANPSATVPPEFLEPGTEYKFEVIVQEESGNRTISEIEFSTME